jgi:hypothetical protein
MKIVIEGTPEECAEAIRRMAAPQDIKPVFVPHVPTIPWMDPDFFRIGDYPATTDRVGPLIDWSKVTGGTFPTADVFVVTQ